MSSLARSGTCRVSSTLTVIPCTFSGGSSSGPSLNRASSLCPVGAAFTLTHQMRQGWLRRLGPSEIVTYDPRKNTPTIQTSFSTSRTKVRIQTIKCSLKRIVYTFLYDRCLYRPKAIDVRVAGYQSCPSRLSSALIGRARSVTTSSTSTTRSNMESFVRAPIFPAYQPMSVIVNPFLLRNL